MRKAGTCPTKATVPVGLKARIMGGSAASSSPGAACRMWGRCSSSRAHQKMVASSEPVVLTLGDQAAGCKGPNLQNP